MGRIRIRQIAVAIEPEELGGRELGREADAEEKVVEPRHQIRQPGVRIGFGVDVALEQRHQDGRRQPVSRNIGDKKIHHIIM